MHIEKCIGFDYKILSFQGTKLSQDNNVCGEDKVRKNLES